MKTFLKRTFLILAITAGFVFLAFKLSPYPSVWIIRYVFNKEAVKANKKLEKFVPNNIESTLNLRYDDHDSDAYMDAYFHRDSVKLKKKMPVIVWTHGGGLISGSKDHLGNYCRLLASQGYLVFSIDYTVAPKAKYPVPIQQLNKALAYISKNANQLNADSSTIILAGDSGGSMISAAAANVITNPHYAEITKVKPGIHPEQLKGLLLYCGIYDLRDLKTDGDFGSFLQTVQWAYFGKKDISGNQYAKTASVTDFLTSSFPPSFISAGNKDPLLPQSELLAKNLKALNVPVVTLFYPKSHQPALQHEYQFTFDESGKVAFSISLQFLKSLQNGK
ncbi:alpha/beta hydrolase [Chryseobacterium daecheongense]|uniref:Acetyl esterase/lipase n=1 Tax=Chryseobacterium daecheongense TaxID=192389 RepID=A0A3N0VXY0_9FLAO|nr:alpha/beta hydrolase [Chryseobacterium daecheongense]ROH97661.1 alpha/beta hydrolase [Chryseobacterium daecheongense]TDX93184.1 acetyl esterase/lipase [Chryseobacterium daecheongense]